MGRLIKWLKESNRGKHFFYAIPVGLIGTILMVIGVAVGMEYKDKLYGNKFDWVDLTLTLLGGTIGQLIQLALWGVL